MIFLGEVPSPIDNKTETNLEQARFIIDTLGLLQEKTKGNLDEQEDNAMNSFLYQLRMKYTEISEKGSKDGG